MATNTPRHNPILRSSATLPQPETYPVLFMPPRAVSNRVHRSTACNTLTHARTLRHGSGGTVRERSSLPPPSTPLHTPPHPPYSSLGRNIHPRSSSRPCGVTRPIFPKPASQSVRQFPPSDPCDFSLCSCSVPPWIIYRGSPPACYPPSPQHRFGERLTGSRK
jgi:hypothetical protein